MASSFQFLCEAQKWARGRSCQLMPLSGRVAGSKDFLYRDYRIMYEIQSSMLVRWTFKGDTSIAQSRFLSLFILQKLTLPMVNPAAQCPLVGRLKCKKCQEVVDPTIGFGFLHLKLNFAIPVSVRLGNPKKERQLYHKIWRLARLGLMSHFTRKLLFFCEEADICAGKLCVGHTRIHSRAVSKLMECGF